MGLLQLQTPAPCLYPWRARDPAPGPSSLPRGRPPPILWNRLRCASWQSPLPGSSAIEVRFSWLPAPLSWLQGRLLSPRTDPMPWPPRPVISCDDYFERDPRLLDYLSRASRPRP